MIRKGKLIRGGKFPTGLTDAERGRMKLMLPYGYTALCPDSGVIYAEEDYILGFKGKAENLEKGEVRICSAGGAEIILKNDGRVIINGKEF